MGLNKLTRLFTYSSVEIYTVFISFFALVYSQAQIHFVNAGRLLTRLQQPTSERVSVSILLVPLKSMRTSRLVSLVEAVERNLFKKPSCLRRAIALTKIFTHLGCNTQIHIGAKPKDNHLSAHIWVQLEHERLEIDDEASDYFRLEPISLHD